MFKDIFEDFEPPFKNVLATPLLKKRWITFKQSINTKIITLHGLLIKVLNKFNKLNKLNLIPQMKKETTTRKYIDGYYHINQGNEGSNIIKSMNKCFEKLLPTHTETKVTFKSTKLSNCFNVKDKIDLEHNHDLI